MTQGNKTLFILGLCFFGGLASNFGCSPSPGQEASLAEDVLPSGSYLDSCRGCRVFYSGDGQQDLCCSCSPEGFTCLGGDFTGCGDIANINGELECTANRSLPSR